MDKMEKIRIPHLFFGKGIRITSDIGSRIEVIVMEWGNQERSGQVEVRGSPLIDDGEYKMQKAELQLAPGIKVKFQDLPSSSKRALYIDNLPRGYNIEVI